MKTDDNPIDPAQRLRDAPRCRAKAKRTGEPCKSPAVKGRNRFARLTLRATGLGRSRGDPRDRRDHRHRDRGDRHRS